MKFAKGISLRRFSKALQQEKVRHGIILDRVERNSVIEGLPRFTKATKSKLLTELKKASSKR